MAPVGPQVAGVGLKSSQLASALLGLLEPFPPATSTFPLRRSVAVWPCRGVDMEAVGVHAGGRLHIKTATVYVFVPEQPCASVAVMVKGKLPAPVGVPASKPDVMFKLSPGGRLPAVTANA
jgi:hypothetical protein